jgi:hypothetical protein
MTLASLSAAFSPSSKVWLKSAAAAFISGGSMALTTWGGLSLAQALGAQVPALNLTGACVVCFVGGSHGLALYLAKSPLPGVLQPAQ